MAVELLIAAGDAWITHTHTEERTREMENGEVGNVGHEQRVCFHCVWAQLPIVAIFIYICMFDT